MLDRDRVALEAIRKNEGYTMSTETETPALARADVVKTLGLLERAADTDSSARLTLLALAIPGVFAALHYVLSLESLSTYDPRTHRVVSVEELERARYWADSLAASHPHIGTNWRNRVDRWLASPEHTQETK